MQDIPNCISGIYDLNGSKGPNKFGIDDKDNIVPDIISINEGRVGYIAVINGITLLTKFFNANNIVVEGYNCNVETKKGYGINSCQNYGGGKDYWGPAMYYCHEIGGHIPTVNESKQLLKGFYTDNNGEHPTGDSWLNTDYKFNNALQQSINLSGTAWYTGSGATAGRIYNIGILYNAKSKSNSFNSTLGGKSITGKVVCIK